MKADCDVAVIGAGVAGSAMADAMARRGWETALIDKEVFPRHKACGEFLSPESAGILRRLDQLGTVEALNPPAITSVRLHSERGVSLEIPLPGTAWGISRHALDAKLQQSARMRGVRLLTGWTAAAVEKNGCGDYSIDLRGRDSGNLRLTARSVIAAWGRRPPNGFLTPVHRRGRSYVGLKSHFTGFDSSPAVDLYFFRGGYFGVSPVEGERLNAAALLDRAGLNRRETGGALREIWGSAAERIPALRERFDKAEAVPGTQAATYPVRIPTEPSPWNGLPCIGDAAAVIPPFCGDGMAMALRSVELCVPLADAYLRGTCSLEEWRSAYTRHYHRHFAGPLRWGGWMNRLLAYPTAAAWLLRIGSVAPETARRLVRATRLGD
ncbi:NAD(P)/FAD-dependent oxidoreductase [Cohnella caldifontis]|uniref:NAD(P)/FAD-dependent oxidoreductase n=1 Tax=Cohnella caldifontis TaxID=3027471 RepID=UPI0023ED9CB1|nr:FAD-dependent monooxygenase [Cohnella sp. YIM B05605]